MAGDWIPMRTDLADDPAVIAIASAVGLDEFAVVGRLHRLWCWANKHLTTGDARSVTEIWVDRHLATPGFAAAMVAAGWLIVTAGGVTFPRFDRWNSKGAKQRVLTARRMSEQRKRRDAGGDAHRDGASVTNASPREEKRREEEKNPPTPRSGGAGKPPKPAHARNELFDAVAEMSGADPASQGSRIGKLAAQIKAAGIDAAEFRERLPAVVAEYAPYRKALDLGTIQACWPWIRKPPATTGPGPSQRSPPPRQRSFVEIEQDYLLRTLHEAATGDDEP